MKILWVITGATHFLDETIGLLHNFESFDLVLSTSAQQTLTQTGRIDKVMTLSENIFLESKLGCAPLLLTKLIYYDKILVAPCTANTVAKISLGISDSLATNLVAQGLKRNVKVVILPTDVKKDMKTQWNDKEIDITCRVIDLENLEKLEKQKEITIVKTIQELEKEVKS